MAGATQIGTASVVLSASADGLVKGFQQAERRVQDFGAGVKAKLSAAVGGGAGAIGGLFGKLAGGAGGLLKAGGLAAGFTGVGAAAGLAAAAGGKLFDAVAGLPALFAALPEKMAALARNASAADAGGLAAIGRSAARITRLFEQAAGKVIAKFGPAFVLAQDWVERLSARAGPLLDSLGAKLGTVAAIAVEVFGQAADAVAKWTAEVLGTDAAVGGRRRTSSTPSGRWPRWRRRRGRPSARGPASSPWWRHSPSRPSASGSRRWAG